MELARWQGAAYGRVPGAVAVLLAGGLLVGCGSTQAVSADAAAVSTAAIAVEEPTVAVEQPEPTAAPTVAAEQPDVDPTVLADELRNAAVQALQLPDPIVEVAPSDDGHVSLAVGNSWETLDLTIRSVEETPTEVVVFASPVRVEWALGDGNELRCDEFGNLDGDGECVHTYPQHGRFEGEIELVWGLSWALDGVHQGIFETTSTGASFVVSR